MKIYSSTNDASVVIIVLGKNRRKLPKSCCSLFCQQPYQRSAVPIDLVKSTYSVEEESTIISFDVRKV